MDGPARHSPRRRRHSRVWPRLPDFNRQPGRQLVPLLTDLPTIGREGTQPYPAPGPLEVHVWRHDHGASVAPERVSTLLAVLSPDEHARLARLRDDRRRQRFVLGRALCRHVLSRYAPVPPHEWRFALGSRGKPFVAAPDLSSPLWFNLSHSDGVSVCAVTGAGPEIGIDIERIARGRDALAIAEQFFPESEQSALRLLPPAQRGERFIRIWALKESLAKARETSLGDELRSATFDVAWPDDIGVIFREAQGERSQDWRFNLFRLDQARIVALAVRTHTTGPLTLHAGTCPEL